MYVFDGKNLISIFGIPYFPVLPFKPIINTKWWKTPHTPQNAHSDDKYALAYLTHTQP